MHMGQKCDGRTNAFDRPSICKALAQHFPQRNAKTSRSPDKLEIAGASPLEVGHALIARDQTQVGHAQSAHVCTGVSTHIGFTSEQANSLGPPKHSQQNNISTLLQRG